MALKRCEREKTVKFRKGEGGKTDFSGKNEYNKGKALEKPIFY